MITRTVTTRATGRVEASPDLAKMGVNVIGEGDSPAVARAAAQDHAETLRESVTAISADRIRTVELRVEDASEPFGPDSDAEFLATVELQIDCFPDVVSDVAIQVTETEATIQEIQFFLHENQQEQLEVEALNTAMERAREKADQLAAAEELAVDSALDISMIEVETGMRGLVDEALAAGPETDFQPEAVTVTQRVEVVYKLVDE